MRAISQNLPFPRGSTWSDGSGQTLSDTTASDLEGKLYVVPDTVHGTGRHVVLRCVKNDSSGDITAARKLYSFSVGALDVGGRIDGIAGSAGELCKPLDDAYTVGMTIPDDDLFYVVDEGPCYVTSEASTYNITAQDAVANDTSGLVNGAKAAAGEYPFGVADQSSTDESTSVVIWINAGLIKADLSA